MLSISENKIIILMPKCKLDQFLSTKFQFISPSRPASLPYVDFLQRKRALWKHCSITAQAPPSQVMTSVVTTFCVCWQFIPVSYIGGVYRLHVLSYMAVTRCFIPFYFPHFYDVDVFLIRDTPIV